MKQITPNQHLVLSYTPIHALMDCKNPKKGTYTEARATKEGEQQDVAIKRIVATRKREISTVRSNFPKFRPGMSTAEYIRLFKIGAPNVLPIDLAKYERPAPQIEGEEVELHVEPEETCDLA